MWQEKYTENLSNIDIKKKSSEINASIIKYSIFETNESYKKFVNSDKHRGNNIKCQIKTI